MDKTMTPPRPLPPNLKLVASQSPPSFIGRESTTQPRRVATEKNRQSRKTGKRTPEEIDEFLYSLLIRYSQQKTADAFDSRPALIDSYRRRRMVLKAPELVAAIMNDKSFLVDLLKFIGFPMPFCAQELVAMLNYREAILAGSAQRQAEDIAADVEAFLKEE